MPWFGGVIYSTEGGEYTKATESYTREFKLEAVQLVKSSGKPMSQIARELGISDSALYHWSKQLDDQGEQAFPGSGHLSLRDQLYLVEHYLYYCQTGALYLRAESHDLATNAMKVETASEFFLATALDLMEVEAQEWKLELAWAQRIRERIISRMDENNYKKREEKHA